MGPGNLREHERERGSSHAPHADLKDPRESSERIRANLRESASGKDPIMSLASRPGCLGMLGSVLAPFVDFFRQLGRGLASLPYEYESPRRMLGLPVLSVNLGFDNPGGRMRSARGVIAIGNQATGIIAFGLFVARGMFAVAPITVGLTGVSVAGIALLSVSVVGVGIVSVSVVAVGYLAVGILALGAKCVGIVAIGREVVGIIGIGRVSRLLFSW